MSVGPIACIKAEENPAFSDYVMLEDQWLLYSHLKLILNRNRAKSWKLQTEGWNPSKPFHAFFFTYINLWTDQTSLKLYFLRPNLSQKCIKTKLLTYHFTIDWHFRNKYLGGMSI